MKSSVFQTFSNESLENSLFDCITFDAEFSRSNPQPTTPRLVSAGIICMCLQGSGTFVINDTTYKVAKGSLITILPNTVIQAIDSSDDFLGYAIAASTKFMTNFQIPNAMKSFLHIAANPVLTITDEQMEAICKMGEMLKRKRDQKDYPYSKEVSRQLLAALCYEIYALYHLNSSEVSLVAGARSRQSALCQEFLILVEKWASEYRDMGYYADKLCITPKYLSVVVKKVTGHSPVEWIDRMVMRYARTLLLSSDMTVQQISAELNFPNPSFFGQYFKRHEGMTPKQFRSKNRS